MGRLEALLEKNEYLVADGATGTVLMAAGLQHGDPPEEWNAIHPDRVRNMHQGYIDAGSNIILTNSFGGTRFRLKLHGLQDRATELNRAAAQIARSTADDAPRVIAVAGSIGPSGEILAPLGDLSFEDAKAGFAEQAAALTEGGADVLWIETMSDLNEVRAAIEGSQEASDLPIVVTMTFDTNGYTMMGVSPAGAVTELMAYGPLAIGGNCGNGPDEIEGVIQGMYAVDQSIPLVAKSNAGMPVLINGVATYNAGPVAMAEYAVRLRNMGATIIGACCGSTPEHIRMMVDLLDNTPLEREQPRTNIIEEQPKGAKRERRHQRARRRK
ncbi:MAG: betaine--homocysteine S-methyltransferase [Chloroflexota bacterium]